MRAVLLLALFLSGSQNLSAKSLGVHGKTYSIVEHDLVQVIQAKLGEMQRTGKLDELQKKLSANAQAAIERPTPVPGITKTINERKYLFDPSITISENLHDHNGNLIHQKGTMFNPFEKVSLRAPILIIDGDDITQVQWALDQEKQFGKVVFVLVKGPILELRKESKREIFFDQQGVICKRFMITQVPARIQQQGMQLLIEEVKVSL